MIAQKSAGSLIRPNNSILMILLAQLDAARVTIVIMSTEMKTRSRRRGPVEAIINHVVCTFTVRAYKKQNDDDVD